MPELTWKGSTTLLYEQPGSPQIVTRRGEISITQTYRGFYDYCLASMLPPGTYGTGSLTGYWVNECNVAHEARRVGLLVVNWVPITGTWTEEQIPEETFSVEPFELNPRIEYHPRYRLMERKDKALIRDTVDGNTSEKRDEAYEILLTRQALARELVEKLTSGQDSYYLVGMNYTWTLYFVVAPLLSRGGVLETPLGPMQGLLPPDFTWLRQCDQIAQQGGYFQVIRSWKGAPAGHWDPLIYT